MSSTHQPSEHTTHHQWTTPRDLSACPVNVRYTWVCRCHIRCISMEASAPCASVLALAHQGWDPAPGLGPEQQRSARPTHQLLLRDQDRSPHRGRPTLPLDVAGAVRVPCPLDRRRQTPRRVAHAAQSHPRGGQAPFCPLAVDTGQRIGQRAAGGRRASVVERLARVVEREADL